MKELILFPFNGNAREAVSVVKAINQQNKTWNIIGFIDDNSGFLGKNGCGYRVLGTREKISTYPDAKMLAVPGRPENFHKRDRIIGSLKIDKEHFATLIHPSVQIGVNVNIGYNTLIMAGVVVTANVSVGNHCVILPNTVISHESIIEDNCMIGSNVSISGGVHIKRCSYIGSGTKLIQEITIGEKTLAGLGSVIIKSTEPESVVAGNPARLLRRTEKR